MTGTEGSAVTVRARFERFPATVKGAFVVRGEDSDPHQVAVLGARVVPVTGEGDRAVTIAPATLDVAPHRDVFVPFEISVVDFDPGWYGFECDMTVDGVPVTFPGDRRFAVAWPRRTMRRGRVRIGRRVKASGGLSVRYEHLECAGDSVKLHLVVDPPGALKVRLTVDGERLEILETEFDADSGRGKVTAYPLPRAGRSVRVEVLGGGERPRRGTAVDVPLKD